ncbi:MAG TPA: DUF4384 domain-containing protein, partial [Longimicrobiaceae bacterium]
MRKSLAAALLLLTFGGAAARPAGAQDGALYSRAGADPLDAPRQDRRDDYERRDGYRQDDYGQRGLTVRVWLENDRDLFYPGAQTRVYVRPSEDSYVAVVHITPDGDVEFLWPRNYYDDGFLEGGRSYALDGSTGGRYLRVGYGYGMGYVFAVASDEPLDLRRARDYYYRGGSGWNASLNVTGDPFHAMERIARLLVPDYDDGYGFLDWYSYSVGSSRYTFPRYACYEGYGAWYGSRSSYYDGCDRVRVLLREVPYYYDTRYYRGDRSRYWRRYYASDYHVRRQPEHRYKESTYDGNRGVRSPNNRPYTRSGDAPPPRSGSSAARDQDGQQEPRSGGTQQPSRQRPTLQRRPPESEPVRVSPQQPR